MCDGDGGDPKGAIVVGLLFLVIVMGLVVSWGTWSSSTRTEKSNVLEVRLIQSGFNVIDIGQERLSCVNRIETTPKTFISNLNPNNKEVFLSGGPEYIYTYFIQLNGVSCVIASVR